MLVIIITKQIRIHVSNAGYALECLEYLGIIFQFDYLFNGTVDSIKYLFSHIFDFVNDILPMSEL